MRPSRDDGFTLIEAVIAVMVISIAVVALTGALTTLIQLTQHHRGHAVTETAARSFGQAVQATAQSPAELLSTLAAGTGNTSLTVKDASTLPVPSASSSIYLLLDREIVRLTGVSGNQLTVVRAQGGTTADEHLVTTTSKPAVVPHLRCPQVADLTPPAASYVVAAGVTPTITDVQYVDPTTGNFTSTSASTCLTNGYHSPTGFCPSTSTLLPECSPGYYRVLISIGSAGDGRLQGISTQTQVLVRSGSA